MRFFIVTLLLALFFVGCGGGVATPKKVVSTPKEEAKPKSSFQLKQIDLGKELHFITHENLLELMNNKNPQTKEVKELRERIYKTNIVNKENVFLPLNERKTVNYLTVKYNKERNELYLSEETKISELLYFNFIALYDATTYSFKGLYYHGFSDGTNFSISDRANVAVLKYRNEVSFFDMVDKKIILTTKFSDSEIDVVLSNSDRFVAIYNYQKDKPKKIIIYDLLASKEYFTIPIIMSKIRLDMYISDNGLLFYTVDGMKDVEIVDLKSKSLLGKIPKKQKDSYIFFTKIWA